MTSALLVFLATFTTVLFLGLQSRNVNQGLYLASAVTSFFIATGSLHLYEVLARPTGLDRIGYYLGGIGGITFSIWFHQRAKAWWRGLRGLPRPDAVDLTKIGVLSLQPGDTVVFRCTERLSAEARERVRSLLKTQFTGHRVLVIDSGAHLQIVRGPVVATDTH